jgi:hypothetical protein
MNKAVATRLNKMRDTFILLNEELKSLEYNHGIDIAESVYKIDRAIIGETKHQITTKICSVCGRDFITDRKNTITCSDVCKKTKDQNRHKAHSRIHIKQ